MRSIIILVFCLFLTGTVQAQVGSAISSDGTPPNTNAMLDVKSPATGDGKGILIPRVTGNQRTNANASLAGGLLNGSGNLRGGAAQGLIVYQTDGSQGLYFNTSQTAAPAWVYLGTSTTNYLPLTGGTMSGALNMGFQTITNVSHIDFTGFDVSVGRSANGLNYGAALGRDADGYYYGAAMGYTADASTYGAAVGYQANGSSYGAAVGRQANGINYGAAVGRQANGINYGAAMGYTANGSSTGVAAGASANGYDNGVAVGRDANGSSYGAAVGYQANGASYGAAVGYAAYGYYYGIAIGRSANGYDSGAVVGYQANGSIGGAVVGYQANGYYFGAVVGQSAKGTNSGVAVGLYANGAQTNVAIGVQANAQGGTERIAIGHNVTNTIDNTVRIRGKLYLDGASGGVYTNVGGFGSSDWGLKAFTIDHPLDPENKILRHFCLEGPQVWNVYAGNAQLVNGFAVVELPDYYSVLNLVGSEICSLTPWGRANVWVAKGVNSNTFSIAGDADVKVSWTIKVLRNDPGCREDLRRRPVEQLKHDIKK